MPKVDVLSEVTLNYFVGMDNRAIVLSWLEYVCKLNTTAFAK